MDYHDKLLLKNYKDHLNNMTLYANTAINLVYPLALSNDAGKTQL